MGKHKKVFCPYCGAKAKLVDSAIVYGQSYGMIYLCCNYPVCDAFVGTHKKSLKPLGTLANAELRVLRKEAHSSFDPLWQSDKLSRKEAYAWLAQQLGISQEKTHIGHFNEQTCRQVIEVCQTSGLAE